LNFDDTKSIASYGTILGEFAESKTGSDGGYSFIGMYGWTHNPCVEWYIVDDTFGSLGTSGTTATIDGATYYLTTNSTTGSGGNACEGGHTGPWTQIYSFRQTARQCGTITVTDHFAAWTKLGWPLGNLHYIHVQVEVGGGTGDVQFAVANVTTN
jgi:endo-1,4-beta-xylanase